MFILFMLLVSVVEITTDEKTNITAKSFHCETVMKDKMASTVNEWEELNDLSLK
jgi:hypothetical protein